MYKLSSCGFFYSHNLVSIPQDNLYLLLSQSRLKHGMGRNSKLTLVPVSLQSQVRLPPGHTLQSLYVVEQPFTFICPQEREAISGEDIAELNQSLKSRYLMHNIRPMYTSKYCHCLMQLRRNPRDRLDPCHFVAPELNDGSDLLNYQLSS